MIAKPAAAHASSAPARAIGLAGAALALLLMLGALLPLRSLVLVGLALTGVVALIAALREPAVALALALLAGPFQPLERVELRLPIDSGQALLGVALLLFTLRWLGSGNLRRPVQVRAGPTLFALGLFMTSCALTYFNARDFRDWGNECLKLIELAALCLITANATGRQRAILIGALLLSASIEAGYGIVQHRICWSQPNGAFVQALCGTVPPEFKLAGTPWYRGYGTFEQPNPFGGYMGLLWPLAAGVAAQAGAVWRRDRSHAHGIAALCAAGVTVLCLFGLYASGSRGALIGLVLAVLTMASALLRRPALWIAATLIFGIVLAAFGDLTPPASLAGQWAEYGDIDVHDAYLTPINFSTIERLAHWQAALRMIEAHPWVGVGYGNYAAAYDEYRLLVWANALGHAHNYYLNIFAETGLLGLLTYAGWWLTVIATTYRATRQPQTRWLALGLLGTWAHLAGHHIFDNLYVANMHLTLGVMLGLLVALGAASKQRYGNATPLASSTYSNTSADRLFSA